MRCALTLGLLLAATGCSSARYGASDTGAPSITLPARFAEGSTGKSEDGGLGANGMSGEGKAPRAASTRGRADALPDPDPPLKLAKQWLYRLEYNKGRMRVARVQALQLDHPVVTPRRLGRFAFELWIGAELVERVRFDFPLLAADLPPDGPKRPLRESPRFAPGAETSQDVTVPASDRATSAVLVDRLTGTRMPVSWPPDETTGATAPASPATPATP